MLIPRVYIQYSDITHNKTREPWYIEKLKNTDREKQKVPADAGTTVHMRQCNTTVY